MSKTETYIPFGKEWEKEMMKHPKKFIIEMLREVNTGTTDLKICDISTMKDAQNQVEGILNDFESGVIFKGEASELMGEYTARLMNIFWENSKKRIRENPELLNEK